MAMSGAHTLLVSESEVHRRAGVTRWLARQLGAGAKVIYAAWLAPRASTPEQHWVAGPSGPRGTHEALASGQLELVDLPAVLRRTGARATELLQWQADAALDALDEGWRRVAMSAESPHRAMAEGEAAELVAHERGLDALVDDLPLQALCQLAADTESETAVWETVGVHHTDLVDETWSATTERGVWTPAGELGAHVARRFGAGLHAALTEAERREPRPDDLHVDLSRVEFLDPACARLLLLTARSTTDGARVVLHRPSRAVRRLVDTVEERGRPRTLVWADAAR